MSDLPDFLSQRGQLRRDEILAQMLAEARRRRHNRDRRRALALLSPVILLAFALGWNLNNPPPHVALLRPTKANPPLVTGPLVPAADNRIEWIKTDPSIAARLTLPMTSPNWQRINDDDLFTALTDAGERGGFVTSGGQTRLVAFARK